MPTYEDVARANVPAEVAAGGSNAVEQYVADWTNWAASSNTSAEHMQNSMVAAQISAGETPAQASTDPGVPTSASGTPSGWVTAYESNDYSGTPGYVAPAAPAAATTSGSNTYFETLTPRVGYDYDAFYKVKPLEDGGTAPTPESINEAFEMYFNRPADMPGLEWYMDSGKSIEQIRADLAYQSLYAPEGTFVKDVDYYEAPSESQLKYIQSMGGGTPTWQREDTFSYTAPVWTEQDTYEMYDQLGYPPTAADIEYWTKIYPTSPDVRFSPNPRMQIVNAILAGSDLPQYQYLKEGVNLAGTGNTFSYAGTPRSPEQITGEQYVDYGATQSPGTQAPFGGYFDAGFDPFDYTGIAPTPLTYMGYDPTAVQYQSELDNLDQYRLPMVTAPTETPVGEEVVDQGIAAVAPGAT